MAYVYRHIRDDKNEPFYIGIGTSKYYKRAKTSNGRNNIWNKIAEKTTWYSEILFDNLTLEEAKKKEIEFIKLYGRIDNNDGILANLSGGGEGMFDVSLSVRRILSEKSKGEKNPFFGKKHSPENILKIKEAVKGCYRPPTSESTKLKIGAANKGKGGKLKQGLKDPKGALSRSGVNHSTYKGEVLCFNLKGELLNTFLCIGDAANYFNTNCNNIRRVIVGERNKYKECKFYYKKDYKKV